MSLAVAHSLDQGASWSQRGTISLPSARSGSAAVPTMDSNDPDDDDQESVLLDRLEELCAQDSMYMLRVQASADSDGSAASARTTETATHACNLVQSGLRDVFTVHLDWRNKVVGVSITPGEVASRKGLEDGASSGGFRSKVVVQHMEPGPQPDTAAFIQRMEQEKIAKERGETKDNRSFFAKYWMYIIPVVLVLAMSGGNPEGGAGGGR